MTLHLQTELAKDGNGVSIPSGIQLHDTSGSNTGPFDLIHINIDSTGAEIFGTQADVANTFTNSTAISLMSVFKAISAAVQKSGHYQAVAQSESANTLGATGATGDYLEGLLIIPGNTSPGNVSILDNATSIQVFVGGVNAITTTIPFFIPVGSVSVSGAWKVTTGANVSVLASGRFT